ncbi:hypothetical protein, partial [Deinococcus wulumuqiensis]
MTEKFSVSAAFQKISPESGQLARFLRLSSRACQSSNLTFYKKYVNSIVRVSRLGVELGHAVR